jgi:hypothetical protein
MNQVFDGGGELALINIPGDTALSIFSGDYETSIAPILASLKRRVELFKGDVATEEGRAEIRKFARALASSKTALDDAGKRVNAELKALPKKIDANRAKAWDTIEGWQKQVRAPLDEYETKEKARVDRHVNTIESIARLHGPDLPGLDVPAIMARLAEVRRILDDGADREEFADEYERALRAAIHALGLALTAREAFERDQAELAALRAEKAARDAKEAAEAAARAEQERIEREAVAKVAAEQAAKEKAEAETREAAAKVERDALQAKLDAEAAERRRLEDEAAARRIADEQAAFRAAQDKREADRRAADVEHRRQVNADAAQAIARFLLPAKEIDDPVEVARRIVGAIVRGEIPGLVIHY